MRYFVAPCLFLLFLGNSYGQPLSKIAIGSCSHEYDDDQMWPYVMENDPDLWIWLGDIIYGDSDQESVLQAKYNQQKSRASYQRLIAKVPVIGIWDDHDYGVNDGGKEYPIKDRSKVLLQEFLDVEKDNPVYNHSGAYNSYTYGEAGQLIKIILLDARYFRDPIETNPDPAIRYQINLDGDVLGEEQWAWLEKELNGSEADIHFICSGIQIIPTEQGYEKWANFPKARKRLFDLIQDIKPRGTIFLSGDRHISELSKIDLPEMDSPIYEFTSSGLTHTWNTPGEEINSFRVGQLIIKKNFGIIDIDWKAMTVTFEIRGTNNVLHSSHKIKL